jgi:hypothetical protein
MVGIALTLGPGDAPVGVVWVIRVLESASKRFEDGSVLSRWKSPSPLVQTESGSFSNTASANGKRRQTLQLESQALFLFAGAMVKLLIMIS